jgi:LysM repeat protein
MPGWAARSVCCAIVVGGLWVLAGSTALAQRQHTVRAGQSVALIAKKHKVDIHDLCAHNRMKPTDPVRPGQVLSIPPAGVVYVRPGWTLQRIARTHGVSVQALARANGMKPGAPLKAGERLELPGYKTAARATRKDFGKPDRAGVVTLRAPGGSAEVLLRDAKGQVPREGLTVLGRLMQPTSGEGASARLPDARLALLLAAISDHFGGREIRIVSGYRPARGNTSRDSRHVHRAAVDIQVKGVSKRALWDYCLSLDKTGCGFYPRSVFVHVDVRDQSAQWVDWSRPGQRSRYGTLRGAYGRNVPKHERRKVGRAVTRPDALPPHAVVVDEPALPDGVTGVVLATSEGDPAS